MLLLVFAPLIVVVVGLIAYYVLVFMKISWTLRKFRGPPAFPLVGNCYDPKAMVFLRYLSSLRKKYGKVFTFYNFSKAMLVVCDPVMVRRILSDSKTFVKGHEYINIFSYSFGQGLVTSNGEKHRRDRSILGKYFIRSSVVGFQEKMNNITVRTIKELLNVEDKKSVNMEQFFAILALRNFMTYSLSTDMSDDVKKEKHFCHQISRGSNAVARCILFNHPMWSIFPDVRTLNTCNAELKKLFHPILEKRRQELASGMEIDDCLSAMIKENLDEQDMQEHFNTLVCAGHDTTAFFLSYMVYLLANHPVEQEKLRQCIIDQVGNKEIITGDDVTSMKYLSLMMMETLRLYAIIPQVTRLAAEDVHFKESGVVIPKGTTVLVPMVVMNRDPDIWENASEFKPERFADKGNDFTSAKDGFFPFSYGSRVCIGNTFAQIESGIVLSHLLRNFIFEPEPGFRPNIMSGISLTTSNGIRVIVRRLNK